jgi:hypothetical protein
MELVVHQAQIIMISIVHVPSDTLEDFVMKISMSVNLQHRLVAMEENVKTLMDRTSAFVQKDMKEKIVQSIQMTAPLYHVKMVELVSMELEITLVSVMKVLMVNIVKMT